jgi:hypothetical protein
MFDEDGIGSLKGFNLDHDDRLSREVSQLHSAHTSRKLSGLIEASLSDFVKIGSALRRNNGIRPDPGPSRGEPCNRASRPEQSPLKQAIGF